MNTEKERPAPRLIPSTRFTLAILVSFALFVQYAQRVGLSMAIVCMVDKSNLNITSEPPINSEENYYEPVTVSTKYGSQFLDDKKYKWSEFQQQILLGAYWFGYIFTLLLSGWLSAAMGAKRMIAGSILLSSIATLGICCIYFLDVLSFYLALLFRMVIGFMHGSLFPASYTLWSQWAVKNERSTLTSIGFCGNNLGTSLTMLFGGVFCRYFASGWIHIFILTAIFGFIWFPLWLWLVSDSPFTHPKISEEEKNYITQALGTNINDRKKHTPLASLPWKSFIRSKAIIGLFITECCNLFGLFFFYTNVGKILTEIHRVPTQFTGYILAGGFILMPISCVGSGVLADILVRSKTMTLTNVRKLFNSIASFVPALCMIVLCFCDESLRTLGVITILILLFSSAVAYGSGYIVNFVDIMPAFSSVVFGITTAAATLGALMANVIAGLIIKKPVLEDWRKLFILFSIIYFIGGVVYIILGSATPRKWALLPSQQTPATANKTDDVEAGIPLKPITEKIQDAEEVIPMIQSEATKSLADTQVTSDKNIEVIKQMAKTHMAQIKTF